MTLIVGDREEVMLLRHYDALRTKMDTWLTRKQSNLSKQFKILKQLELTLGLM